MSVVRGRIADRLPTGWRLAAPGDQDTWEALVDDVVAVLAPRGVGPQRVRTELDRARSFMAEGDPARQWFVVTADVATSPVPAVLAVGWLVLQLGPRPAAIDDTAGSTLPGVMTVSARVADVGGRETLLRHDLVVGADDRIRERVVAVGHDPRAGVQVALEVSTSDLAAFDDLDRDAAEFLAAFQWDLA